MVGINSTSYGFFSENKLSSFDIFCSKKASALLVILGPFDFNPLSKIQEIIFMLKYVILHIFLIDIATIIPDR